MEPIAKFESNKANFISTINSYIAILECTHGIQGRSKLVTIIYDYIVGNKDTFDLNFLKSS